MSFITECFTNVLLTSMT